MDAGNVGSDQDWHTTDIEVRIKDSYGDWDLAGTQAVIRSISVRLFFEIEYA